jgi:hypothetical protein
MVLLGFAFLIFSGIYFLFWASFKIMSWIPYLLLLAGVCMVFEFVLDHWIITLVIYTILAAIAFYAVSDDNQE